MEDNINMEANTAGSLVYIQSLPISKLAEQIGESFGSNREQGFKLGNSPGAVLAGSVIGSMFGNDD